MNRRAEILERIAACEEPVGRLVDELRSFPWDWEGEPLLVLTGEHFLSVMDRFLSGLLTPKQVQEWAESFELRDDVGFTSGSEEVLEEILFCLAVPSINYGISIESIGQLKKRLVNG